MKAGAKRRAQCISGEGRWRDGTQAIPTQTLEPYAVGAEIRVEAQRKLIEAQQRRADKKRKKLQHSLSSTRCAEGDSSSTLGSL